MKLSYCKTDLTCHGADVEEVGRLWDDDVILRHGERVQVALSVINENLKSSCMSSSSAVSKCQRMLYSLTPDRENPHYRCLTAGISYLGTPQRADGHLAKLPQMDYILLDLEPHPFHSVTYAYECAIAMSDCTREHNTYL